MAAVKVGDVWGLKGTARHALVIFVRTKNGRHAEDVRVVPIYKDPKTLAFATSRDAIVPTEANSFGVPLMVATWNARGLTTSELEFLVGRVDVSIIDAVRAIEMSCIIPDLDLTAVQHLRGPELAADPEVKRSVAFQRRELKAWDAAVERLQAISEAPEVLAKGQYVGRRLPAGSLSYVSEMPVWYDCLLLGGESDAQAFCLSPGLQSTGTLGDAPTELPSAGQFLRQGPARLIPSSSSSL